VALFLDPRGGPRAALENTQPPSLLVGVEALSLAPGVLAFLVARALVLCGQGWSLLGKFAPKDVLVLAELATRFAGGEPPPLGLPAPRAGAFLQALAGSVPAEVRSWARPLGPPSAEELRDFDPRAFSAALQRTACRVALLYTGDVHGALTALSGLDPAAAGAEPGRVLEFPDPRDLALFALSDLYGELRRAVV
jgi:hypothetical protein